MRLTLYADDLLIYKPILTESSHLQLQGDINSISLWADNNLMTFNASKCKCMLLTNNKSTVFPTTTLNDHPLEVVYQIKYLGVTFSHNHCWSPHVQTICKKARRKIIIVYRQFSSTDTHCSTVLKLYIALVRPHLEYAAQVWNPHLAKDIEFGEGTTIRIKNNIMFKELPCKL